MENGQVPKLPEASLGPAPAGGGALLDAGRWGVTGWLLSLLRQHLEGQAAFPLSCHSSSKVWASPGLEQMPFILHV